MKRRPWKPDKKWADQFLPEIERIIREVAGSIIEVKAASQEADEHFATDYVVTVESGDIACRIRKWHYWEHFGDLTFRYSRPSGAQTEVEKIQNGFARWYLYAWANDGSLGAWVFINLDIVREQGTLLNDWPVFANKDGSSRFVAIPRTAFKQDGSMIACGGEAA